MSDERLDVARRMVHQHVESGRSPSVVAVVARHGKVVLAEAAGVQGPDGPPLSVDHVWPIASAGKPMTSALVMSLVEDGLLGINEPIVTHLPELAGHEDVLVHHLLTHSTGWESAQRTKRLENAAVAGDLPEIDLDRDFISGLFLGLAFDPIKVAEPGDQMDYDTGNYALLSELVRRVTGSTMDAAMRSRVFEPAGMERSAVIVGDDLRPDLVTRAPGLPFGPDAPLAFEGEAFEASDDGGSGLHMSAPDLIRFGQLILQNGVVDGRQVLSTASVQKLVTNRLPGTPALFADRMMREASWGYGFTVVSPRPYAYFVGGLVPDGSATHPGAGGIGYWIDFDHEIGGVWFEVITEMSEFFEPVSGIGHRFQNVVTAAAVTP
jgi:CubicO group peptidase (beta-lactamase class C family)